MAKQAEMLSLGGYPATVNIEGDSAAGVSGYAQVQIPPGITPPDYISQVIGSWYCVFALEEKTGIAGLPTNATYSLLQMYPVSEEAEMVKIEGLDEKEDGLYAKYRVFREPENVEEHPVTVMARYSTGSFGDDHSIIGTLEEVTSFIFPLKPDTDSHARVALAAYAWSVRDEKPFLWEDLMRILDDLPQDF